MVENGHAKRVTGDSHVINNEKAGLETGKDGVVSLVQEVPVKRPTEIVSEANLAANTPFEIQVEGAAETKPTTETVQLSTDFNAELERAAIARLAKMEEVAERERQRKIKRREELDRIARLQRIVALVQAPESDSVAKGKLVEHLEQVTEKGKEVTVSKGIRVVTEINPIREAKLVEVKEVAELKRLSETKPNEKVQQTPKYNRNAEPEGIARLERMSKMERIFEIDRLTNLELAAEAKRKVKMERIAEVERLEELERVAKMKRIREIDLKSELEKAEKERMAEKKQQEKVKRQEELERVAKLQRVLVMVRASETDHVAKAQAANLEQIKEIKLNDELKLLEELGIVPKRSVAETDSRSVKPIEGGNKLVSEPTIADINLVKVVPSVPAPKKDDVNSVNVVKSQTEVKLLPEDKVAEELVEVKAEPVGTANLKHAPGIKDKAKADSEVREKRKQESQRVANLQRLIASVLNAKPERAAELKQVAEKKRKEEASLLELLGIVSKDQATQTNTVTEVKSLEEVKQISEVQLDENDTLSKDVKPMKETIQSPDIKADVNGKTTTNVDKLVELQGKTKTDLMAEIEKDAKIKRAEEMERKARADREARIKRREELARVADLQRVVAMVQNDEFDNISEIKQDELKRKADIKRKEDIKVLEELGLVTKKEESESERKLPNKEDNLTNIKRTEEVKAGIHPKEATGVDLKNIESNKEVENLSEFVIDMEQISEKERMAVKRDVEKRLAELRVAQMKRVAELGREMKMGAKNQIELNQFNSHSEDKVHKKEDITEIRPTEEIESSVNVKKQQQSKEFVISERPEMKHKIVEGIKTEEGMKSLKTPVVKDNHELKMIDAETKRLKEMKRVVGLEQVRGRECEWDGQMMYVGKA